MVDMIWWSVGVVGMLIQAPFLAAYVLTGPKRMFPKVSVTFEQRLIDSWDLLLGMFLIGAVGWAISGIALRQPWWLTVCIGILDVWIIAKVDGPGEAQDDLNSRLANSHGEFYCRECEEIHKIGEPHA
jgi:hypothetical protein